MGCWSLINLQSETQKKLGLKGTSVPCGRCIGCLSKRRRDWFFRLNEELRIAETASFLTLTYEDEKLPQFVDQETGEIHLVLDKKNLQDYFKRVRKDNPKLKYYACGEYGTKTNRPHYHAVVFNADPEDLADKWELGITHQGSVKDGSIKYVTKYLINTDYIDNPIKPFALMSKGLGKIYLKNAERYHKSNFTLANPDGSGTYIPRYYREKIFSKAERKLLAEKSIKVQLPEVEIMRRKVQKHNFRDKGKSKTY